MTLFALAITAAGCAADGATATDEAADQASASDVSQAATVTGMRVVGNQLQKDGVAFLARGFNMIGALTPAWCNQGTGIKARDNFGSTELSTAVNDWHANTIRLQVSQRGLEDPTLTQADRDTYLALLRTDVLLARSFGLVVILSMQDQSIGCGPVHPLPSTQTVAAWQKLAPAFANWGYVMYELFNEPQNGTSSGSWAQWRDGGSTPLANLGDTTVGHQALVAAVRNTGAKNVLLADAALHGEHLDNITPFLLTDQSGGHGIAYAIHPYFYAPGAAYWQTSWGFLTASRAVIATEWNFKPEDCGTSVAALAPSFLAFLHDHGIGITAHAFDFIDTLIADFKWTPTACGTASGGAGQILKDWYAQLAG